MPKTTVPKMAPASEADLARVRRFFRKRKKSLEHRFGRALRKAVDEQIDPRTGRYSIDQLTKQEKAFIGTKVEIVVREEFDFDDGVRLDFSIEGVDVDIKYSADPYGWMIPDEAKEQVCLLVTLDDNASTFSVGLLLAKAEYLRKGCNKDGKVGILARARSNIEWLIRNGALPGNFLLHQPQAVVMTIQTPPQALQRCVTLFKTITNTVIPRLAIETVAKTRDPTRRAREAAAIIEQQSQKRWRVLRSGGSKQTELLAKRLGVPAPRKGEYVSCPPRSAGPASVPASGAAQNTAGITP